MYEASFINDQVESATQSVKVNQLIPQFIHQSWKTHTVPEKFNSWDQTWKHQNPDYNYILWNDQENEDLIRKEYPWFLDTYLSYSHPICRADAARVFYLHRFGGVYVDLDIAAYKPLEGLLGEHQLVLAQMQTERRHAKHGIPNGFMASKPGHGFWMHCARKMMLLVAANQTKVELLTGPIMLWDALDEYLRTNASQVETIFIADSKLVFPFSWSSSDEATKAHLAIPRPPVLEPPSDRVPILLSRFMYTHAFEVVAQDYLSEQIYKRISA
ncbi:nucleotide-diphospho-sugar transferase [Chytriomyces sp. MP71]|nr:nucleotide-diphospho-sugar transferase [Chytriomyces sp. MP71]